MKCDKNSEDILFNWQQYEFSELEKTIWRRFFGTDSEYYRLDFDRHVCVDEIARLNSMIQRLPKYDGKWVYRCCHKEDRSDFEIGDEYIPMCNLTTSTLRYFWKDNDSRMSHKYLIKTLPKEKTRAHDLRVIRCDADECNEGEKQINFELGTKFRIDDIKMVAGKKHIYMTEIEQF